MAAYEIQDSLQLAELFPIGAVVFDLNSATRVHESLQFEHVEWTYVLQGPGLNPKIHMESFTTNNARVSVIGVDVATPIDGVRVALAQRVDFVEMCGGFGPRYAYIVRKNKPKFPVGAEVKGNEFRQKMIDIIRPRSALMRLLYRLPIWQIFGSCQTKM
jgi:hypothetical protein